MRRWMMKRRMKKRREGQHESHSSDQLFECQLCVLTD